ncbi:MAG: hypothetical protein ACJZ59_06930 [Candidatus Thalassarchaeaceae archaeon]
MAIHQCGGFFLQWPRSYVVNSLDRAGAIGFTSSEWVVDQERINSTHSAILVQGESQGLRFADLTAGGTNQENVWLATVNETGAWTDLGHFWFGEDRDEVRCSIWYWDDYCLPMVLCG